MPVIGVLHGVSAAQWADRMAGFHQSPTTMFTDQSSFLASEPDALRPKLKGYGGNTGNVAARL
jgi:hypothetical protein